MRRQRLHDLSVSFLDDPGRLLVRAPTRGVGARVPAMAVAVLTYCSHPRSRAEVQASFGPPGAALFDGLVDAGLLCDPDEAAHTPVFFDNFASVDTHRRMLADHARVSAYRAALDEVVGPGSRVLDAGTGSGVLACLAARAGAAKVIAVDASDVVTLAEQTVIRSGLQQLVEVRRADFATLALDTPVDVLVSETFGAFALAEGAGPDLAACCARNLAPGGVVIPSAVSLHLAPVSTAFADTMLAPFSAIPGVDLSALAEAADHRAITSEVPSAALLHPGDELARFDWPHAQELTGEVSFHGLEGPIGGLCGWFELQLSPSVTLSTGPAAPPTHWQQLFLPLAITAHDGLRLSLSVRPAADDRRGLELDGDWHSGKASGHCWHRIR